MNEDGSCFVILTNVAAGTRGGLELEDSTAILICPTGLSKDNKRRADSFANLAKGANAVKRCDTEKGCLTFGHETEALSLLACGTLTFSQYGKCDNQSDASILFTGGSAYSSNTVLASTGPQCWNRAGAGLLACAAGMWGASSSDPRGSQQKCDEVRSRESAKSAKACS
jgi:hypothetical protein